jgi:hypothetical protein
MQLQAIKVPERISSTNVFQVRKAVLATCSAKVAKGKKQRSALAQAQRRWPADLLGFARRAFFSMLFCRKLLADLKDFGFEINPCDPCVASKMVEGKQLTACWRIDDLKASHMEPRAIDSF